MNLISFAEHSPTSLHLTLLFIFLIVWLIVGLVGYILITKRRQK